MKRSFLFLALVLATAAVIGLGYSQTTAVRVGVLVPLTGFAAADGMSTVTGVRIAADEINQAGGILGRRVELVEYDDKADPREAVNFARRLIELDRVAFAIGGSYSGATLAAAPVFNEARVPLMGGYAVAPDITLGKPYVFRVGLLGPVQGRVGAVVAQMMGARRVAVLTIQNDFGRALEEGFRDQAARLGLEIVFLEGYPLGNQTFVPLLSRIRAARPDLIYASGYYTEASSLVRQARSLGMTMPIIGQEGYDSPKFIELAGRSSEGVLITTTLDRDDPSPEVQNFLRAYAQRTGIPADMVGASGYAALKVMALAAERAGSLDGEALRRAMGELRDVDTAVGRIYYWTPEGDPVKSATVQVVRGGEFHRYLNVTDLDILRP